MFFLRYVRIMPVLFSSDFSSKILSQTLCKRVERTCERLWSLKGLYLVLPISAAVHQCITAVETATEIHRACISEKSRNHKLPFCCSSSFSS